MCIYENIPTCCEKQLQVTGSTVVAQAYCITESDLSVELFIKNYAHAQYEVENQTKMATDWLQVDKFVSQFEIGLGHRIL